MNFRLVAKTSFGLEDLLVKELISLGAKNISAGVRMVSFEGDQRLMYNVNLRSRIALRILKPIKNFKAASEQQLYEGISRIDWTQYIDADDTIAVDAVVNHSNMDHSLYVAQKTKDAVADQFRERTGKRPSVDLDQPTLRIHVHISANEAEVSLDSSGDSLHKRGYRQSGAEAPLNESLAAGLILLSGWDAKSPFVDLMCGSGTIVIEAALMALNKAPGLIRKQFGFERWKDFDRSLLNELKEEATAAIKKGTGFPIAGIDQSPFSLRAARDNAAAADVSKYVSFKNMSFEEYQPAEVVTKETEDFQVIKGTIVTNPPYGGRITSPDLFVLYKNIGDALKQKFSGWQAFVFTANKEAAKHIGLRPSRKIQLFNGKLECRLFKFELYKGSKKTNA
jgi:putative N6-adenine-specific DNA methylase